MKKKIALILCLLMVMVSFAGCSPEELGYLKLNSELMDMEGIAQSGSLTLDVNMKNIETAAKEVLGAEAGIPALTLGGNSISVTIDYTATQTIKDGNVAMEFAATAKTLGKTIDFGKLIFDSKEGIFVSKTTVLGIYQMLGLFDTEGAASYAYSSEFTSELTKSMGDSEYISILGTDETSAMASSLEGIYSNMGASKDIYKSAEKFLTEGFKDYSTGAVKSISGGYEVNADATQMLAILKTSVDYIGKNLETILPLAIDFLTQSVEMYKGTPLYSDMLTALNSLKITKAEQALIATVISEISTVLDSKEAKDGVALLNSSYYKEQLTKSGNTLTQNMELNLAYKGSTLGKINSKSSFSPFSGTVTIPKNALNLETVITNMETTFEAANPVTETKLSWKKSTTATQGKADVSYSRKLSEPTWSPNKTSDVVSIMVKDSQSYIPLRSISEQMGETVGWDKKTGAYIMQGEKQILMSGLLSNGTTYIKVRDFEKLGYTVDYSSADGMHLVKLAPEASTTTPTPGAIQK